jgi:hypothetical protein
VLLVHRPQTADVPASTQDPAVQRTPGLDTPTTDPARAKEADGLLSVLGRRLQHGSRQQVEALAAGPRAQQELAVLRRNVRTLGVTDVSLRYLRDRPDDLGAAQEWVGDVRLRWRLSGFDAHDSQLVVPVTFSRTGAQVRFVTARRNEGGAAPMWLLEPVSARRTPRSLVVTSAAEGTFRYSRLADQAVADVLAVLPRWSGRLVVEVPGDAGGSGQGAPEGLARVLGSAPSAYAEIAAVTTTADGSVHADAPVHIFVNAPVFDPLGPRGAQIVMSHEATHVATGAALSSVPTWLMEGFADYVALDHAALPVTVAASQVLASVRRHGAPSHLPGTADFDPHDQALGASYESAWLACRLLGRTYGERRLVAFYRVADRDSSTARAFRSVLGTDEESFTRAWRRELRRLAG